MHSATIVLHKFNMNLIFTTYLLLSYTSDIYSQPLCSLPSSEEHSPHLSIQHLVYTAAICVTSVAFVAHSLDGHVQFASAYAYQDRGRRPACRPVGINCFQFRGEVFKFQHICSLRSVSGSSQLGHHPWQGADYPQHTYEASDHNGERQGVDSERLENVVHHCLLP